MEIERVGQTDWGCERWVGEKEMQRGWKTKIEVDKRKSRNTKGRAGKKFLKEKVQTEKQAEDLPDQKQMNEMFPDDQVDFGWFEKAPEERKLPTRKNTKKQWQYICKIKEELFV